MTSKSEEYSRGISYSERPKSVSSYHTNVNRLSGINRTSPLESFFGKCYKIRSTGAKFHNRSLTDLSKSQQHWKERRRTKSLTDVTRPFPDAGGWKLVRQSPYWTENINISEPGRRIINLLMLNAWRRRREDNEEARAIVKKLTNEVGNLNMQVYVLRQLLDNKRTRAILAAKDLQKHLLKIEKYGEEKRLILKEKETLECEIKDLQDFITDLQSKCKNLENDLDTAKLEAETWELRVKKERKKLRILKEQNATLQKEAQSREDQLDYQSQCLEELNQTVKELQQELESRTPLLQEAMAQIRSAEEKLKLSDELEMQQGRIITEKDQEIKLLKAEIALMEEKFREQDERNGELGKLISDKTKELIIINEKLVELAKADQFWGKRMVKMASICTRIPIACFYTVATLLLPQPWYRLL